MMNFWICSMTQDNLDAGLEAGVIGFNEDVGRRLRRAEHGDKVIFYVPRRRFSKHSDGVRKLYGLAEVMDSFYESADPVWPNGVFPCRVKIKVVHRKSVDIRPLIKMLSFITNKENWGSAFLSSVRNIPESDFKLILSAYEGKPPKPRIGTD
jgi:predicted RNA-binding protein